MKTLFQAFSFILALSFLITPFTLQAQDTPAVEVVSPTIPEVPQGPITTIEFDETVFDFGTVTEGTKVVHVFTFTNTSDEMLILADAKGSCGCTVPQWPRYPIAPGETASITVEFNSKNKRGKRNQRVTLTANTDPAQTFIYLKGDIESKEETDVEIPDFTVEEEVEELDPSCFAVYPNPTTDLLVLDMKAHVGANVIISIYSKEGQLMAKRDVPSAEPTIEFNVGHYPPGTYIANLQVEEKKAQSQCFVVVNQ